MWLEDGEDSLNKHLVFVIGKTKCSDTTHLEFGAMTSINRIPLATQTDFTRNYGAFLIEEILPL